MIAGLCCSTSLVIVCLTFSERETNEWMCWLDWEDLCHWILLSSPILLVLLWTLFFSICLRRSVFVWSLPLVRNFCSLSCLYKKIKASIIGSISMYPPKVLNSTNYDSLGQFTLQILISRGANFTLSPFLALLIAYQNKSLIFGLKLLKIETWADLVNKELKDLQMAPVKNVEWGRKDLG